MSCAVVFLSIQVMKKIFIIPFLLIFSLSSAQTVGDAIRYSNQSALGNARFASMGGAMSALGGNLSAMEKNPAGGAVFMDSHVNFSLGLDHLKHDTGYFGGKASSKSNNFDFTQAGGIFVFYNEQEHSVFRKLTIGATYSQTNDFRGEVFIKGNGNNSFANYFLSHAQGTPLSILNLQNGESISGLYQFLGENYGSSTQTAFLGYQGYLFDPVNPDDPSNTAYTSNVSGSSFDQQYLSITDGGQARFTINLSAQLEDRFYVGMNVNTHTIDFRKKQIFLERNGYAESKVSDIAYEEFLNVIGNGISVQFGGIARLGNGWRFGLHYDSPTWYTITEETAQILETRHIQEDITRTTIINPRVLNVYEDYKLRTPGKLGLGLAYVFGQSGLISLDYAIKNYGGMKYGPSSEVFFQNLNASLSDVLGISSTIKAGGEYRWNSMSFRGGAHFEQSPYKNSAILGDRVGFSLGTGYSTPFFSLDFAYAYTKQEGETQMFSQGMTDRASIDSSRNIFILSVGFAF